MVMFTQVQHFEGKPCAIRLAMLFPRGIRKGRVKEIVAAANQRIHVWDEAT